ncbi:glycosyltransferase family 2 protein [Desulfuromonas sp. TF]|jgi:glycosyltransferase involved in cell wall biosynthesis|uniref:glycosyltransferase family 2 protein n=1 Tax=Desulfuromonas sp. TF TaxID=1232410 RepID=UPI00041A4AE0|nr:glycosyltransferase [Desulfuromonas sp. TF]
MTPADRPLVTIGIPTYNRADGYLRQALKSALDQTWPNIEVIVADNCSSDRTDELVAGFGDPRIRYFKHSENIGANNNFNFCVDHARGKYFLLLHDDDLIDEDFIETCMKSLGRKTDVGIIRTGTRIIDQDGNAKKEIRNNAGGLPIEDFFREWFKGQTALYLCSTLFNSEYLNKIGGFKSKKNLFQDVVAEFLLAAKLGRIDVPEVKASYRKHDETITYAAKVEDWCEDSLMLLDLMCELALTDKELIRAEGSRYLSKTNYRRASLIKSTGERLVACCKVYKMFNFAAIPPVYLVFPSNPLSRYFRLKKQRKKNLNIRNQVEWQGEPKGD